MHQKLKSDIQTRFDNKLAKIIEIINTICIHGGY